MLGADSTSSAVITPSPGAVGYHYFNHNQKLFELGENATVGVLTWGWGGLTNSSHRTMLALLADDLKRQPPTNLAEIAERWAAQFWAAYASDPTVGLFKALAAKSPHVEDGTPSPAMRTKQEETLHGNLRNNLAVGFCIAGYVLPDRSCGIYETWFEPSANNAPAPVRHEGAPFWGAPNMIKRLIMGADDALQISILNSGKWSGTQAELASLVGQHTLVHGLLPIRDAIDFVHTCIHSTIKAMKFSSLFQVCGGPIEIAVITSDRPFRWVQHKPWDAAIMEGLQ